MYHQAWYNWWQFFFFIETTGMWSITHLASLFPVQLTPCPLYIIFITDLFALDSFPFPQSHSVGSHSLHLPQTGSFYSEIMPLISRKLSLLWWPYTPSLTCIPLPTYIPVWLLSHLLTYWPLWWEMVHAAEGWGTDSPPPKCWDCRCVPSHLNTALLEKDFRTQVVALCKCDALGLGLIPSTVKKENKYFSHFRIGSASHDFNLHFPHEVLSIICMLMSPLYIFIFWCFGIWSQASCLLGRCGITW
jgi:hypothetical protein